jgi:hypothetical protein
VWLLRYSGRDCLGGETRENQESQRKYTATEEEGDMINVMSWLWSKTEICGQDQPDEDKVGAQGGSVGLA